MLGGSFSLSGRLELERMAVGDDDDEDVEEEE